MQGNICLSKLTMDTIRSKHADFYDLPDHTRYNVSIKSSNHKMILSNYCRVVQTISPILNFEGTGTQCINQKAPVTSDKEVLSRDCVTGLEGETVTCEDVTFKSSTSILILEG